MAALNHQMAANGDLEISITGTIGDDWSEDSVTANAVRKILKGSPNSKTIRVHIDSLGGSFFEGLSMYQMLRDHGAKIDVSIGAIAASAASLAAMAGDTISMDETSSMLLHPVWNIVAGNAKELRKAADDLDLLSESAIIAYSSRSGMSPEDVRSLLDENRFMSAAEAKKLGLCTEIRKRRKDDESHKNSTESEVRSEVERMRTRQIAGATAMRIAAMAPQQTPPEAAQAAPTNETTPPAPTAPETNAKEVTHMTFPLSAVALGLPEGATDTEFQSKIATIKADQDAAKSVLEAVGAQSAAEAIGTIAALLDAKSRLSDTEAKLAELESKQIAAERTELIAKMRTDGKCSPAQEKGLFPTLSLESLRSFAETAVPLFSGDGKREPGKNGYQGKPYQDLTNKERLALGKENPELFAQLRDEASKAGLL